MFPGYKSKSMRSLMRAARGLLVTVMNVNLVAHQFLLLEIPCYVPCRVMEALSVATFAKPDPQKFFNNLSIQL